MVANRSIPPFEVSLCHIARTGAGFVRFQSVIPYPLNDTLKSDRSPLPDRGNDTMTLGKGG